MQASSSLYDVPRQYDPGNLLLAQARAELLTNELDMHRLAHTLRGMQAQTLSIHALERPTPFAMPLMVERCERLSTETLADCWRAWQALEQAADATTGTHLAQHARQPTDMVWDLPESSTPHTTRARLRLGTPPPSPRTPRILEHDDHASFHTSGTEAQAFLCSPCARHQLAKRRLPCCIPAVICFTFQS